MAASMDQQSRQYRSGQHIQRRRLALLMALAFALVAWGPRAATVITDGWYASCQALEQQRQIDAARQRIDVLHREVAYARTIEGRDVEAKRRFGVGPDDEVWITVEAERAAARRERPQSVADRVDAWLTDVGSRFVDRVREFAAIVGYWLGIKEVDGFVAVPVIEEQLPAASADSAASSGTAQQTTGADDEAAGDATESP